MKDELGLKGIKSIFEKKNKIMNITQLPSFFKDDSKSDKYEELIDFFMSWTIRCADKKYEGNHLINKYSKKILSKLIFNDENKLDNEKVVEIKVWKQSGNIDLWIELEIENYPKKTPLIIESKMYSSIRPNQLSKYRENVLDYYKDKDEYEKAKFVLLRPDYEHDHEKDFCSNEGFSHCNLALLQELLTEGKTNNDLFDEFWFNW